MLVTLWLVVAEAEDPAVAPTAVEVALEVLEQALLA
jgi:hypothetical protein